MAMRQPVEALDGTLHNDGYWIPVQINIGVADRTGLITFYAYSSPQAMDSGKAPIAGAVKQYTFSAQEFAAAQMIPMGALFPDGVADTNILYEVLGRFAYGVARSRKDVPLVDVNGDPVMEEYEEDGETKTRQVMVSFFENAVDV